MSDMRPRFTRRGRPNLGDQNIGKKFNSWTILSKADNNPKHRCQCDCGAIELVAARNVILGYSQRCRSCASKIPRQPYRPRKGTPKVDMERI